MWEKNYNNGCTFEQFIELSQKPCHYCNSPPQSKSNQFTYNGLDRIDPYKDHSVGNVVPCCGPCNMMKGRMGYDAFLKHVSKIHNNIPLIKSKTYILSGIETIPALIEQDNILVDGWYELQLLVGKAITASETLKLVNNLSPPTLIKALQIITGNQELPSPHTLGRHLRDSRDKFYNGKVLRCIPNKNRHKWYDEVRKDSQQPIDDPTFH